MDKLGQCILSTQVIQQMKAELMIRAGIIEELKDELHETQQRTVQLYVKSHQPPCGGIFMP